MSLSSVKKGEFHPKVPTRTLENLISWAGVTKLLKGLDMNKSSGPDKISPKVLNELTEDVAPHLTSIFTTSLGTGRISHQWTTALVAPIFKKGERCNAANYRPVSRVSICCKSVWAHHSQINHATPGRWWLVNIKHKPMGIWSMVLLVRNEH